MARLGPTFAVWAILLVVLGGMVVMLPGDTAATSDVDLLGGVDDSEQAEGGNTVLASAPGPSTLERQYGLYEELSTYVPTGSGHAVSSRADRTTEDGHESAQRLHRWRCPICDATKLSFGSARVDPHVAAANNLRSHIRNTDGAGHGPEGTLPEWITPEDIVDGVAVLALAD